MVDRSTAPALAHLHFRRAVRRAAAVCLMLQFAGCDSAPAEAAPAPGAAATQDPKAGDPGAAVATPPAETAAVPPASDATAPAPEVEPPTPEVAVVDPPAERTNLLGPLLADSSDALSAAKAAVAQGGEQGSELAKQLAAGAKAMADSAAAAKSSTPADPKKPVTTPKDQPATADPTTPPKGKACDVRTYGWSEMRIVGSEDTGPVRLSKGAYASQENCWWAKLGGLRSALLHACRR